MTKTELKRNVESAGSHFFERSSMKFFGDTMANYYVPKQPVQVKQRDGSLVQCWELQRRKPVIHGLNKSAYFSCVDFSLIHRSSP